MPRTVEVSSSDDIIDLRDVIARFEELEEEKETVREEAGAADTGWDNRDEFNKFRTFLEECKGNGGDHEWRGDWYPVTAIRYSYFKDYAQELAEDIGAINADATWPNNCIDWDQATRELKMDYTTADFDAVEYYIR